MGLDRPRALEARPASGRPARARYVLVLSRALDALGFSFLVAPRLTRSRSFALSLAAKQRITTPLANEYQDILKKISAA